MSAPINEAVPIETLRACYREQFGAMADELAMTRARLAAALEREALLLRRIAQPRDDGEGMDR